MGVVASPPRALSFVERRAAEPILPPALFATASSSSRSAVGLSSASRCSAR
jgi:hypothetical protein